MDASLGQCDGLSSLLAADADLARGVAEVATRGSGACLCASRGIVEVVARGSGTFLYASSVARGAGGGLVQFVGGLAGVVVGGKSFFLFGKKTKTDRLSPGAF